MCGRFSLVTPVGELKKRFNVRLADDFPKPRYNAAPGQLMPVIEMGSPRQASLFQWGLVPPWAKDPKIGSHLINARAETVRDKPSFRTAFKKHRCLVLADGFFEWDKKTSRHVPYYIKLKNGQPFALAGLSAHWEKDDQKIDSFTIITTQPNRLVGKIHDRMPVILFEKDEKKWLDPLIPDKEAERLLKPYPASDMEAYQISTLVNNPENNVAEVIRKI